ncbi:FxLD family lanthipeptide [Nonomuraea sp. NPDC046570]|uniref:FxLD family lanthipeptide n=1 Tax=Nonomuraea sp. NPDC046570 TaxID=3155255 RepID=UPI0033C6E7B3
MVAPAMRMRGHPYDPGPEIGLGNYKVEDAMPHKPGQTPTRSAPEFDLDVRLLEVTDPGGLINVTDDGCTSTCGACVTGAA